MPESPRTGSTARRRYAKARPATARFAGRLRRMFQRRDRRHEASARLRSRSPAFRIRRHRGRPARLRIRRNSDAKIAACTRVIEDAAEAPHHRTLAYRNRGNAYGNRKLHALANLDFAEALKLSPQDQAALFGRARSFAIWGSTIAPSPTSRSFSSSIRKACAPSTSAASPTMRKGDLDLALADFESALRINPHARARQEQSGARVCEAGQVRGGDRRLQRDDPHRAQLHPGLLEPRPCLRGAWASTRRRWPTTRPPAR